MHGKLTEDPTDARNVDDCRRKVPRTYGMFMECPPDAQKVNGSSLE